MKKKALLLVYDFPPYNSVGALRPAAWRKYLDEYKVDTIVVTRDWVINANFKNAYIAPSSFNTVIDTEDEFGKILNAPYFPSIANKILLKHGEQRFSFIRKSFSALDEIGQYVLPTGTKRSIFLAADAYLKQHKVDVIIATGDPFILFKYASDLGKKHHIPWIADYRDPWSHYLERKNNWLYRFYRKQELRTVRSACAITTVSQYLADKLDQYFPDIPKQILPNGYDPENVAKCMAIQQQSDVLTIAHAGTIYDWHPLERFLDAVGTWKKQNNGRLRLVFYGLNQLERLTDYLNTYQPELRAMVECTPRMPNEEMLIELRKANVMLMFNYYAYMGTKIFDYIAIERTILLCFENDPVAKELKDKHYLLNDSDNPPQIQVDTLKQHNAGIVVQDHDQLISVLNQLQQEFDQHGCIHSQTVNKEHFSRKYQTQLLAQLIHSIAQ